MALWICRVCNHETDAADCPNEQRDIRRFLAGVEYRRINGIKAPPPDDTWKDWPPTDWSK